MFALFRTCRKGTAAVEAALVFPVLIGLTLAAVEFSFILFTNNTMQSVARDISRQLALSYMSIGDVESAVGSRLPGWAVEYAEVSVTKSAPGGPANLVTVDVSLPAGKATPIHFITSNMIGDMKIGSSVTMKQSSGSSSGPAPDAEQDEDDEDRDRRRSRRSGGRR